MQSDTGVQTILQHDLMILEEMAGAMDAYLVSEIKDWRIPRVNMPKLTIGGYLMRQYRLQALKQELTPGEQQRLETAVARFENALHERIVRFETRAHQEIHQRLSEWVACLRDLKGRMDAEANHYAGIVDVRVVIECLMDQLKTRPYQLEPQVVTEINTLDKNLRRRWEHGRFVWEPVWEPAYPAEKYWFLYGQPRID